jgi:hypothetical protein
MGAEPYWYIVPYESDIDAALQKLRQREFRAGRYNPVTPFPKFPVDLDAEPAPAQHGSIEEVMEVADEDGTRSILDIQHAAAAPFDGTQMQFFTAFPLVEADLVDLFGSVRPTREIVEHNDEMWELLERGSAIYVVLFDNDRPSEILFAGYSFD